MICLRLRAPWLSLALLTICVGHAFAQVPATLSASFNPSTVVAGGANTTVYDVTISNPNGSDTLTGIAFSVSFPASITLSSFGSVTCAGSGGSNPHGFNFSGVTLAAGETCDVPVRAKGPSPPRGGNIVTTSPRT